MFGYIVPHFPELKVKEAEFYRSIYCGLCRTMGKTTGQLSRMTLSYDMAFLVLVRLALTNERATFSAFRCGVHPLKRRVAMDPCEALRFSALASGLLVHRKWKDNLQDEKGIRRFFYRLLSPFFRHIGKKTVGMETVATAVDGALAQLHELECTGSKSADACADSFGKLLGAITADRLTEPTARIAYDIGFHTGRFIYLLDAIDDAPRDKQSGAYNPFVLGNTETVKNIALQNALRLELGALERAVSLLDIADNGVKGLLENILYLGMPRKADQILGFLPRDRRVHGLPKEQDYMTLPEKS